jgi:hypothetical protein
MSCKDIEQKLPAYLEDDLSLQEKGLVEEHLASCQQCKKAMEDLEKTENLIREMEEVEPPPWFTQRIMSHVRGEAQQKESIFRKFFYPLHIKIPIQALATVLIAVLAFQIYRVGEPDMKVVVVPPSTVFEARKEPAPAVPQKSPETAPAPSAREKAISRGGAQKERDMQAPATPPVSDEAPPHQETRIPHEAEPPAQKSMIAAKKKDAAQDRVEEEMHTALSAKTQEAPKAMRAQAPEYKREESLDFAETAREKRRYEATPAAPQMMGAVIEMPARISVAVHVKDVRAAAREVESLLEKSGARKIQRQSREGREVLTAVIGAQNVRELREKLKAIGKTEEKGISVDLRERDVSITIELFSDR